MVALTWEKNDGFDPHGRRVASVGWYMDPGPLIRLYGESLAPRWYWEAFVAHDGHFTHVLVDGEVGRWKRNHEAKAAAEAAYRAWLEESGGHGAGVGDEVVDGRDQKVTGVVAHIRSLVRAWRTVYRRGPSELG